MDKDTKIATVVATLAAAGGAALLLVKNTGAAAPSSQGIANIQLNAAETSIVAGSSDTFTATSTDASGAPVSGATITFLVNGTASGTATSDANGNSTFSMTFNSPGTYKVVANG